MRTRLLTAALVVALLGVLGVPAANAQEPTLVGSASLEVATEVVNGRVLVVQSIDSGAEVHTLAMVEIDETLRGSLSGQIFVEVPGGRSAQGLDVIVSHQPHLQTGSDVQLALVRSSPEEEAVLTGGMPVYSIVGGIEGAASISGSLVSQAEAAGDFSLTGTAWASFPIDYKINPANAGVSIADATAALQGGFDQWAEDPGSDITFNYQGTTNASPSNFSDGQNTVGWVTTPNAADGYLAQAVWVSSGGTTLGFDIRFNRDYQWTWGAQPGKFDIETVNLHEVGHALGLGHVTEDSAEIMFPTVSSNTVKGLGAGDRSGVASLYPAADPGAGPPAESEFYLNFDWDNRHDVLVTYGASSHQALVGDWDGDGVDEIAVRAGSTFFLNYDEDSTPDHVVEFGSSSDVALVGDWDGDGTDELALRRGNEYHLSFEADGEVDLVIHYGRASDYVFVGDWDGDGTDELAIRRGNRYYLNFEHDATHDKLVAYGRSTDEVFVGDWDGDGVDELGMRRGRSYYLNFDDDNVHDLLINYGRPTDTVLSGDWDADGVEELGIRR